MPEFLNEEDVIREFEGATGEKVEEIKLDDNNSINFWRVETVPEIEDDGYGDYREYWVFKSIEAAKALAREWVEEDLFENLEYFNQDWLRSLMTHRLSGESFVEYVAEQAVNIDGFAHFLPSYDENYILTGSGFVVVRIN